MGPEASKTIWLLARSTTVCKSVARAAKTLVMVLYGMSRIIGGQSVLGKGWLRVGANESEHATPSKCLNFPTSSFAQNINMPSHNLVACLSVVKMKKKWRSKERLDAPSICKCPVNVL